MRARKTAHPKRSGLSYLATPDQSRVSDVDPGPVSALPRGGVFASKWQGAVGAIRDACTSPCPMSGVDAYFSFDTVSESAGDSCRNAPVRKAARVT